MMAVILWLLIIAYAKKCERERREWKYALKILEAFKKEESQ